MDFDGFGRVAHWEHPNGFPFVGLHDQVEQQHFIPANLAYFYGFLPGANNSSIIPLA
jgi:hypothetical protein